IRPLMSSDRLIRARAKQSNQVDIKTGFQGWRGSCAIIWLRTSAILRLLTTLACILLVASVKQRIIADLNPMLEKLLFVDALTTGVLWAVAFAGKAVCFPIYIMLEIICECFIPALLHDNFKAEMHYCVFIFVFYPTNFVVAILLSICGFHNHLKRKEFAEKEELIMRA
ncbi:hypothetical protein PFISCL1PPCAC_4896, partial [Pristionchus fissidentatus]